MPFVTLNLIKPYICINMFDALGKSGEFEKYEAQASYEIRDMTGWPIPDSVNDRPDWVDSVISAIIEYKALNLIPDNSEAELNRIKDNYKTARQRLQNYRYDSDEEEGAATSANCGTFQDEDVW